MGQCNGRENVVLQQVTPKVGVNGTSHLQQQENGPVGGLPQFLEVHDRFGNPIYFSNAGEVLFFPSPLIPDGRQRLVEVKQLELRSDDVVIAGFVKSGNHWVQQIVRMLLQNNVEYKPNTLSFEVFEYIPPDMMTPPDQARVFFTHLRFPQLPAQVCKKKVKVIHLLRNPKDTFVSLYCHVNKMKGAMGYRGTWDHFFCNMLEMGLWHGDWFDHILDWEREITSHPEVPVFVLPYEDLIRDTLGQIQKLNTFLGLNRSEELCRAIVQTCQVDIMRKKEESLTRSLDIFTKDSPGIYRKEFNFAFRHTKPTVLIGRTSIVICDWPRDTLGQIQKLNTFLGLNRSEELCRDIVQTCQVDIMRKKEETLTRSLDIFTKDSPGIYRKGQIGDWKNWFTPNQNRLIKSTREEWPYL